MKWLSLGPGFIGTESLHRSISVVDSSFYDLPSVVTSGLRTAEKQLAIIVEKVKRHDAGKDFFEWVSFNGNAPALTLKLDDGPELYWWQRSWSKLLSIGEIVNPPVPAKCLFDYWRPGDPKDAAHNKKGTEIGISRHMKGLSFDIGGGDNLAERAKRVMRAKQGGKAFLKDFLVEHGNNAVHCDVVPI